MCEAEGPEWDIHIVTKDFTEYLLDFMGSCGMVVPGGVTLAERCEGVFHGNLHEVISHFMGVWGWSGYMWLLQERGPVCLVNGILNSLRGIWKAKSKP